MRSSLQKTLYLEMAGAYLNNISKTTAQGDAREESYYPYLKSFIDDFSNSIGKTKTQITTLPKKTEAGNPDFRVWDGKQHIVGYIEAKKPGENLDTIETSAQLKRYRNTFPNLILTDFYEFRLYRNGQLIDKISIGRPFIAKKLIPFHLLKMKISSTHCLKNSSLSPCPKFLLPKTWQQNWPTVPNFCVMK